MIKNDIILLATQAQHLSRDNTHTATVTPKRSPSANSRYHQSPASQPIQKDDNQDLSPTNDDALNTDALSLRRCNSATTTSSSPTKAVKYKQYMQQIQP